MPGPVKGLKIDAVIPARYGSTRFEGKPLALIHGKPMIQHVYERTRMCPLIGRVIVATDHEGIWRAVKDFGGEAILTSSSHRSGTDRIAEVARGMDSDIIVNVQGDEPLIEPMMLEEGILPLIEDKDLPLSTLASRITDEGEVSSPHVVKVVFDNRGYALYFSRSPIPYRRKENPTYYKHIGIYFYRRTFLLHLTGLDPTPLEEVEGLEQLRVLENGFRIKVVLTDYQTIGVDTPEDIKKVEEVIERRGDV